MSGRLENLARVFEYPGEDYAQRCRDAGLEELAAEAETRGCAGMQELFVGTFDWNPAASLDLSWHLYGEQYARGEFLAQMRDRLRRHGIEETAELPDHITHVLALFSRMDAEAAERFAREYAAPAVAKLAASLEQAKSPFAGPMRAVREALPARAPIPVLKTELPVLREESLR
ncbi:MAG: nitrate reductase molybdenum cofactor assembly chaperone [Acidobacteriota bacterium]|nr:nitrate reductase molybdenum cofactor assembly chaperone [Acidobacteriota bacterium]